jgi:hypothetical protein
MTAGAPLAEVGFGGLLIFFKIKAKSAREYCLLSAAPSVPVGGANNLIRNEAHVPGHPIIESPAISRLIANVRRDW